MADVILTITIPSAKVAKVREAMEALHPKDDQGITNKQHLENLWKYQLINEVNGYWRDKTVREAESGFTEDHDVVG